MLGTAHIIKHSMNWYIHYILISSKLLDIHLHQYESIGLLFTFLYLLTNYIFLSKKIIVYIGCILRINFKIEMNTSCLTIKRNFSYCVLQKKFVSLDWLWMYTTFDKRSRFWSFYLCIEIKEIGRSSVSSLLKNYGL